MKLFDVKSAPLEGTHLIEAGAGTGKTYSIASVFLRLVLERELPVDQILVLTYTRAATLELKERIRAKLFEMKQLLDTDDQTNDALYLDLRQKARDGSLITKWSLILEGALADFDNANIHNFHQFCQKVIKDYAVETGGLFDAEVMPDNSGLMEQAAEDFWRQSVYHADPLLAGYLADRLKPADLVNMVRVVTGFNTCSDLAQMLPPLKPFDAERLNTQIKKMDSLFREIRNTWLLHRNEIVLQLNSSSLYANIYGKNIPKMLAEMDIFCGALLPYPLPCEQQKWQADYLRVKTKKGCPVPEHRFFDLWQAMGETYAVVESEAQNHIHNLKIQATGYISTEMAVQKRLQNKLDFNDLIVMVGRTVLQNADETLRRQLKNSFRAVMVDEFQDTDALQYEMFSGLFADTEHLFFMIGDPKQAIYAFRGADVFSYFTAAKSTRSRFSLPTNRRSTPNLVHAVNQIFKNHPDAPFVVNDINFEGAVANAAKTSVFDDAPMIFWYLDSRRPELGGKAEKNGDYSLSHTAAAEAAVRTVAKEILNLLNDKSKGLKPKDIAVLVNTNPQGRMVYKAMEALNIPATLSASDSVFQTPEARELLLILESAAQPDNLSKLKAAYTTTVFGGVATEYLTDAHNEDLWLRRMQNMRQWQKSFSEHGVLSMFLNMVFAENSFGRLLSASDGRRKVTNFVHLAELLHSAAQTQNLTLTGLTRYLRKSMQNHDKKDENDLRLETDSDVVQIITVHKSKGLEYEVVFYPFGWDGVRSRNVGVYKYHQQNEIELGFEEDNPEFSLYLRESLAEKLRLLYVALTRAKQRCYVIYGRVKTKGNGTQDRFETAALTYLLLGRELNGATPDLTKRMQAEFKKTDCDDNAIRQTLDALAAKAPNCIQVHDLPFSAQTASYSAAMTTAKVLRTLERRLNSNWKVASFSSLTQITSAAMDIFEGRDWEQNTDRETEATKILEVETPEQFSIFNLPKGAHVGNFFHDLLEDADLSNIVQRATADLIITKLSEYNLDERFAPAVAELLVNLCHANLAKGQDQVALKDVSKLLREMEFYFPLNSITQEELRELFVRNDIGPLPEGFAKQSAKFMFAPAEGYLKGFIDLTFCYNNRYYVLDWKSNYEGAHISDYSPEKLLSSVAGHSYFLQYYLYTLALCQYLRLKLPEFKYERDFGGVFYVFLRGFAEKQTENEDFGVFRERPPLALINALGRLLITNFMDFEE